MPENKISIARYVDDMINMIETLLDGDIETMLGDKNHLTIRFLVDGELLRLELTKEGAENG